MKNDAASNIGLKVGANQLCMTTRPANLSISHLSIGQEGWIGHKVFLATPAGIQASQHDHLLFGSLQQSPSETDSFYC